MILKSKHIALMAAALFAVLPACSSTGDENPAERRAMALEAENETLRRQIEGMAAVESALNRDLESQRSGLDAAQDNSSEIVEANDQLRRENARLQQELNERSVSVVETKKSAVVDANALNSKGIEVIEKDDGDVLLRLGGMAMFQTARDELTKDGKSTLNKVAAYLKKEPTILISVEGHTDATPLGKTKKIWGTNLALSLARAMAVHDYLKSQHKISSSRMRVVGYGEHRPIAPGKSKAANAKNRRVEIVLHQG